MLGDSVHILSESYVYSCVFKNESFQNILEPHLKYVKVQVSRVTAFSNLQMCFLQNHRRTILFPPPPTVSVDLPEQWLKGNGSFYVFSNHNKTWSSSRKHCQDLGGDLVFINNTEEKVYIKISVLSLHCACVKKNKCERSGSGVKQLQS